MFNLTNILLTVGAFAIIFGVATVFSPYKEKLREKSAPFLRYLEPEYDRNLFPQSARCDDESLNHLQIRVNALKVRYPNATERYSKDSDTNRRD